MQPIWSLSWIINSWAEGLPRDVRERFLDLRLRDLTGPPRDYLGRDFVRALPQAKAFELASATMLFATKPQPGEALQSRRAQTIIRRAHGVRSAGCGGSCAFETDIRSGIKWVEMR